LYPFLFFQAPCVESYLYPNFFLVVLKPSERHSGKWGKISTFSRNLALNHLKMWVIDDKKVEKLANLSNLHLPPEKKRIIKK